MSFYIQQKLPEMRSLFGDTLDGFNAKSFDELQDTNGDSSTSLGRKPIYELLHEPIEEMKIKDDDEIND